MPNSNYTPRNKTKALPKAFRRRPRNKLGQFAKDVPSLVRWLHKIEEPLTPANRARLHQHLPHWYTKAVAIEFRLKAMKRELEVLLRGGRVPWSREWVTARNHAARLRKRIRKDQATVRVLQMTNSHRRALELRVQRMAQEQAREPGIPLAERPGVLRFVPERGRFPYGYVRTVEVVDAPVEHKVLTEAEKRAVEASAARDVVDALLKD